MARYRVLRTTETKAPAARGKSVVAATPAETTPAETIASLFERNATRPASHAPSNDGIDVCAFLFEHCKEWQRAFLDDAGLTCMFDVDAGDLPRTTCETLASLVRNRMKHLTARADGPGGTVTVTLRRRGAIWALAVSDTFVRQTGPRIVRGELAVMRTLAARLGAAYVIQSIDDGTLIAVLFSDVPGVLSAETLAETRDQFRQ
jgi:hypothetical protein